MEKCLLSLLVHKSVGFGRLRTCPSIVGVGAVDAFGTWQRCEASRYRPVNALVTLCGALPGAKTAFQSSVRLFADKS